MNKNKLVLSAMSAVLTLGFMSGCGVNNNRMTDDRGVDYTPVRYDRDTGIYNNDVRPYNRTNIPDRDVDPLFDRGTNRGMDFDRTNRGMFNRNTNQGRTGGMGGDLSGRGTR